MTKEDFIKKCLDCIPTEKWVQSRIESVLYNRHINLDNVPNDYRAVYPLMAAILERVASDMINGGSDKQTNAKQNRLKNRLKKAIW
jgi:hypothetical protein